MISCFGWLTKFAIFFTTDDWRNLQFFAMDDWRNSQFFGTDNWWNSWFFATDDWWNLWFFAVDGYQNSWYLEVNFAVNDWRNSWFFCCGWLTKFIIFCCRWHFHLQLDEVHELCQNLIVFHYHSPILDRIYKEVKAYTKLLIWYEDEFEEKLDLLRNEERLLKGEMKKL